MTGTLHRHTPAFDDCNPLLLVLLGLLGASRRFEDAVVACGPSHSAAAAGEGESDPVLELALGAVAFTRHMRAALGEPPPASVPAHHPPPSLRGVLV